MTRTASRIRLKPFRRFDGRTFSFEAARRKNFIHGLLMKPRPGHFLVVRVAKQPNPKHPHPNLVIIPEGPWSNRGSLCRF